MQPTAQTTVIVSPFSFAQFRTQCGESALPILFTLFGLIMGTWAGRIPALRDGVHVSHSALSMVLLCGGLGAVLSFPITSRLMASFGGRKTMLNSGMALLTVLISIGLAPNVPLLMAAVLMLGITASCFDVAMNSVATKQEKVSGTSQLSKLHAWACGGGLVGATLGSLMARMQVRPALHFTMIAGLVACGLKFACDALQTDDVGEKVERKPFALPRGPLILLGGLGFFGAVAEGSIADWSGIFMKDHFGVTDGFAPLALSAFSVMMLMTRIAGDRLKSRHSARRLLQAGGLLAATGLFCAVSASNAFFALGGFALAGTGMALVFPFVFSAAGQQGPIALSGVASMAYSGSLMGPPMLGALAQNLGMQAAMGFIGFLSLVMTVIAGKSALLR